MTARPAVDRNLIVHVAQIDLAPTTGMGRVAWHWRRAFEERGYRFLHLGKELLPAGAHPARFPLAAWRAVRSLPEEPAALLLHEPAAFPALVGDTPAVVFSHGLERRGWEAAMRYSPAPRGGTGPPGLRSRLLYPLWRLFPCDLAARLSPMLLVLNHTDREFAARRYGRPPGSTPIVRNGVEPPDATPSAAACATVPIAGPTVLFVGSYLARKGVEVLQRAAGILEQRGRAVHWLLAGTVLSAEEILPAWPAPVRARVEVVRTFARDEEAALHARSTLFVLPSFFEGQPLSLLQAMASGRCPIVTGIGGQADLVRDGENGLVVPAGDPDALADAIERALATPELRRRLAAAARRTVADRTWRRVSHEVVDLVEEAIERGRRRR